MLTENKLFNWRKNVHAVRHLQLVDLELDPFAEGLEVGGHGGGLLISGLLAD